MQRPDRARAWLAPAGAALAIFAALAWRLDFLVDDAFISFRYARHLAAGLGLRWNPGEEPPVEGFSNFLWTVLCAGLELARLDPAVWTRLIGAVCAAAMVMLVARLVHARVSGASSVVGAAAVFAASATPLVTWATGGLETAAFALAVFASFERLMARAERSDVLGAAIAAALAVLLRADGCVWIGMVLTAVLLGARGSDRVTVRRGVKWVAAAAAITTLAYLAFRWSYFEALQPNTARIKVALGTKYLARGMQYVASLLLCVASLPLALAAGVALVRRDASGVIGPCLVFVLAAFAYLTVLGGDWMMMHRMAVPVVPFVAVIAGACFARIERPALRVGCATVCAVLGALPAFDVHVVPRRVRELAHFRWSQEFRSEHAMWKKGVEDMRSWIETGRALGLHVRPGESMVLGNIGALGYYAPELVVYDTQGLTNREPLVPLDPAAHEMPGHDRKVQMDVFEKYQPTYFISRVVGAELALEQLLPKSWSPQGGGVYVGSAGVRYRVEQRALDPARGFAPGRQLILIRFER